MLAAAAGWARLLPSPGRDHEAAAGAAGAALRLARARRLARSLRQPPAGQNRPQKGKVAVLTGPTRGLPGGSRRPTWAWRDQGDPS